MPEVRPNKVFFAFVSLSDNWILTKRLRQAFKLVVKGAVPCYKSACSLGGLPSGFRLACAIMSITVIENGDLVRRLRSAARQ